ncbi:hypothetical protein HY933_01775 [Candidatus Falkowbacteria bacterium]|nr:hypothetical protein [Candidatus Falkowbacteria bacterium]
MEGNNFEHIGGPIDGEPPMDISERMGTTGERLTEARTRVAKLRKTQPDSPELEAAERQLARLEEQMSADPQAHADEGLKN